MNRAASIFPLAIFALLLASTQLTHPVTGRAHPHRTHDRTPKAKDHTPQVRHIL